MPTSARAVRTVFTKICGESVGSQRADVGISPNKHFHWNARIVHHRRICRCAVISTAACFTIFLAWKLFPMGALFPRRRRCSSALQRDSRVLAAMFFYGLILWHRGTIRSASSASFCILFLTSQKQYARRATVTVSLLKTAVPVPTGNLPRASGAVSQPSTPHRFAYSVIIKICSRLLISHDGSSVAYFATPVSSSATFVR